MIKNNINFDMDIISSVKFIWKQSPKEMLEIENIVFINVFDSEESRKKAS